MPPQPTHSLSVEGDGALKVYETSRIRNVALAGHTGAGKTSLGEAMLYTLKQTDRLGKTDDGNTVSDYDAEEIRRHHSIQVSLLPVEHDGAKINLIDLPGFRDFVGEIKSGLRAADSMLLVFDANGGVETGAETVHAYAVDMNRPRAYFINMLDKEHASYAKAFDALRAAFEPRMVRLTLPVGEGLEFKGVIDLMRMKFVKEDGQKVSYEEIPADLLPEAQTAHAELIEIAAEGDEELLEKFLGEETLSPEEILKGLSENFAEGGIVPVLCGSATALKGIRPLLDFLAHCAPDPTHTAYEYTEGKSEEIKTITPSPDGSALLWVFKTVADPFIGRMSYFKVLRGSARKDGTYHNVNHNSNEKFAHPLICKGKKSEEVDEVAAGDLGAVAKLDATRTGDTLVEPGTPDLQVTAVTIPKPTAFAAITAKSRADEDKVGIGFHRLMEQDPTLSLYRDPTISQTILSGMGETHLQVAVARLKDLVKVEVDMEIPRVPYRETITRKNEGQGKYKKQTGGHGQYGDCWIRFEPLPEGSGFEFEWAIVGGVIPTNFKSAVEKGLLESLEKGVLSGCPTVDIKATCYDGSYHAVDSSDMSFKVAASLAFKNIIPKCAPIILEPIYKATISVPEEYMGDVMGDLNSRRGRILGMNQEGRRQIIEAHVPLAELYTYGRQLNSLTRGRGVYEMEFDHYERVPNDVQEKIVAEYAQRREAEAE